MATSFTKMHGAGNDFVMLDGIRQTLPHDLALFSKRICHRRFGIGADQVLIAYPSKIADFKMAIYNADGGVVEMCGNGIRAFAKFLIDTGLTTKTELTVETLAGIIRPSIITQHPKTTNTVAWVRVDMGEPVLDAQKIPTLGTGKIINQAFSAKQAPLQSFNITCVSMGNPHCVIFVDDTENFSVTEVGPKIENDRFFPNRTNVEFVTVKNRQHLIQRTWERGSGETYACGTGASAVLVAAVLNGLTDRKITISLKGGDLDLEWDEKTNHVFKTGPAETVFTAKLSEEYL